MYDIFYVGKETDEWQKLKSKYPLAQRFENISFNEISRRSLTSMFWVMWDDVVLNDIIDLKTFEVPVWDRKYIHVFKNGFYNFRRSGICLFPKKSSVSNKEFDNRFFLEKKEIDIELSKPRVYDRFTISSYDDYLKAVNSSTTEMLWTVWEGTEILDDSVFKIFFDPLDGTYDFDRNTTHIFKNRCGPSEEYVNGTMLSPRNNPLSKREIENRFPVDKKEHDTVVTISRYPRYFIDTYAEYQQLLETSPQEMFWVIWPEIKVTDETIFDLYFDPNNGAYDFDRNINHVFQHKFKSEKTYNGIMLMSKHSPRTAKEIDFRFLLEQKEYEIVVSVHKPYDIVFISYNEPNADENFKNLSSRFKNAKRVHGVKGIHQAHIEAAKLVDTHMFWVVDGDAVITDDFNFDYRVSRYERDIVCVWHSKNPINNLTYGYGGVKLLPRDLTLAMDTSSADMTTSISKRFRAIPRVSNITSFNTDPFNTWKSAFRECCKLASKIIDGQVEAETQTRLDRWCILEENVPYGFYAYAGALAGKEFGMKWKDSPSDLAKINDFDWLEQQFKLIRENV